MRLCIGHAGDISEPSGGTDRVTAIATGFHELGHDVVVVVPEPDGDIGYRLDNIDIRTVSSLINNAIGRGFSVARRAATIARTEDRRLQLEHSALGGIASMFVGEGTFVLDMHDLAFSRFDHVDHRLSPVMRIGVMRLERRAVEQAGHIVSVSDTMATIVKSKWEISNENISVVPNGYFPEVVEDVADTDREPGRVVFLGTLHPKVDVETLWKAAELDEVEELLVIGDGAQRRALEKMSRRYDTLKIMGRLPNQDAFQYVASAQAVINPQIPSALQRSSSPVKLYYYAALGKPIVATTGPDIVTELCRRDAARAVSNQSDFLTALREVLNDEDLGETLGTNAASIAAEYRWPSRIDSLAEVHQNINV